MSSRRLTNSRWNAVFLLSAAALVSCGNDEPDQAAALLASIQAEDYRETWERAPGYETRQPSATAHSDAVDIFVNDVMAQALSTKGLTEWPVGSIVAKDGYDSDGALALTAIMEKRESGWFWAELNDEGEPTFSGEPDICVDCHDSGSDFVRAFSLP